MKIETKKIKMFLKSLPEADYLYLGHVMEMRDAINNLINRHNLTPEDICQRFKISTRKYGDFIVGNYEYSLMDMARLNASFVELETKKLEEKAPIQVASKKY